jgi:hypothetical protein
VSPENHQAGRGGCSRPPKPGIGKCTTWSAPSGKHHTSLVVGPAVRTAAKGREVAQ